jgi:hypothetical protein
LTHGVGKNNAQNELYDFLVRPHTAFEELDEVQKLIDWKAIESYLANIHNKKQRQEAYPPIIMFKVRSYALTDNVE